MIKVNSYRLLVIYHLFNTCLMLIHYINLRSCYILVLYQYNITDCW